MTTIRDDGILNLNICSGCWLFNEQW